MRVRNIRSRFSGWQASRQTVFSSPFISYVRLQISATVRAALPDLEAGKLIELCQTTQSPRVSFETAQPKTLQRAEDSAMRYKNNTGPQVRRRRYALGWSQSDLATKLQLAGLDTSRSGVSKIEARLSYVDDKTMLYLAEVLKVQMQYLFPARAPENRIHEFMEKLETTRF